MKVFTFKKLGIIEAIGIVSANIASIQVVSNAGKQKRARERGHGLSPLSSDMT